MRFVEPDKWYFVAECVRCGEPIPFAQAPSPDEDPAPKCATVDIQCPHCRKKGRYAGRLITRRQGPESK